MVGVRHEADVIWVDVLCQYEEDGLELTHIGDMGEVRDETQWKLFGGCYVLI